KLEPRLPRVIDDLQAECLEPPRYRNPNTAQADHPDGAVAQHGATERKIAARPFAGAQIAFGLRQLAHGVETKPDRRLGDLLGEHVGRMGDDNAASGGGLRIDVVVADAEASNDLQLGK